MNKTTTTTAQFRKSFTSEDNLASDSTPVFVPSKISKETTKGNGLEYRLDVTNDAQFIAKIFETNSYDHSYESLLEYYSEICYIMDSQELGDQRNVGAILGMTALGAFGIVTLSVSFVGGVAGVIFGGTLGRIIANKFSDRSSKKNEKKATQEDLYRLKLQCLLQLAKEHKKKSKDDLNKYRLIIEKILEESSPALETSIFKNQKAINDVLIQMRKGLMDPFVQKAVFLSYKLLKVYLDQNDMNQKENMKNAAKKLNGFFIPYTRFIELDQKALTQTGSDPSLSNYYKIKALLSKPEIIEIVEQFPEFQMTQEVLENFRTFMRQEVDTAEPIKKAVSNSRGSQPATLTENIALKGAIKKSPLTDTEDRFASPILRDSSISHPSLKDLQLGEAIEGVNVCRTEVYNVDLSKMKSLYRNDSYSRGHMGPKMISNKLADISLNDQSSMNENEWARKQEGSESPGNVLVHKSPRNMEDQDLEKSDNQLEIPGYKKMVSKNPESQHILEEERQESPVTPLKKQISVQSDVPLKRTSTRKETESNKEETNSGTKTGAMFATNKIIFDRVLSIAYDEVTKWEKVCNNPTIKIEKVRPEGSPVVLIRAWAFIEGFTPKEVFDQIYDSEKRGKWDTVTVGLNVVEQLDENTAIIHFIIKAPFGVSDRDFVQKRNFQLDYPEKGTITMSFQSFAHPKMPPHKNRIRGETHIAGYVLKPSTRAPNSTDLCILTQVDIKGSIPKIVVNLVAGKAPAEWVNKLVKACERTRHDNEKK